MQIDHIMRIAIFAPVAALFCWLTTIAIADASASGNARANVQPTIIKGRKLRVL